MEKTKSKGTSGNARNRTFGAVPFLRNASGKEFSLVGRGSLPRPIERKHDDGRYKLAGETSGSKLKSIERGRPAADIRGKNEIDSLERGRKRANAPVAIKTTDSLDRAARMRTKSMKDGVYIDLTRSERRRRDFQQNTATTDKPIAVKTAKNARGVTSLGKMRVNMARQKEISNKHVVDTTLLPNSTESTQYDPHKNNTNLAAPSDSSLADPSPQPVPPLPRDPSPQYQADPVNTGLDLPADIPPFLFKKSSRHPLVSNAFCDRLAITLKVPEHDLSETIFRFRDLAAAMKSGPYTLRRIPLGRKKLYDCNLKLLDEEGKQVALIQCGPKNKKANFSRIEFNPKEIGPEGIYQIKLILKGLFGHSYSDYLAEGNFTRLDATLDIDKLRTDDVMMVSNRARNSSRWQRSYNLKGHETWATETVCVGSSESDYFATAYDKAVQLWQVKGECLADLRTRIEVRINPRGKDGRAILVKDILQIKNPFAVISIAYYPAPDGNDPWFEFFVCASRHFGQEEALRKIKDRSKRSLYRFKLIENEPDWWKPEKLWAEFLNDLRGTGLFPDEIFSIR